MLLPKQLFPDNLNYNHVCVKLFNFEKVPLDFVFQSCLDELREEKGQAVKQFIHDVMRLFNHVPKVKQF